MSLKGHVTYHSLHASAATRLNEIGVIRKTHCRKISDIGYELPFLQKNPICHALESK